MPELNPDLMYYWRFPPVLQRQCLLELLKMNCMFVSKFIQFLCNTVFKLNRERV